MKSPTFQIVPADTFRAYTDGTLERKAVAEPVALYMFSKDIATEKDDFQIFLNLFIEQNQKYIDAENISTNFDDKFSRVSNYDLLIISAPKMVDFGIQADMEVQESIFNCSSSVHVHMWNQRKQDLSCQASIPLKTSQATQTDFDCPNEVIYIDHPEVSFVQSLKDAQMRSLFGVSSKMFNLTLHLVKNKLKEPRKLSKAEKLAVCLMKMKLNISNEAIGAIIGIDRNTVGRWIKETIPILAEVSKAGIIWFSRDQVDARMPPAFKALFPKARALLDCTEVFIQQPKTQEQKVLCFSNYKSHLTLKFLVSSAPSGEIVHLSPCFGGRSTDSEIVNRSGILNLIEPGDQILADKGFPGIEMDLNNYGKFIIIYFFDTYKANLRIAFFPTSFRLVHSYRRKHSLCCFVYKVTSLPMGSLQSPLCVSK